MFGYIKLRSVKTIKTENKPKECTFYYVKSLVSFNFVLFLF